MGRPAHSETHIIGRRQRIRAVAFALFAQHGVSGVSLRAIGDAIGLSAVALYRYFPGGTGEILAAVRADGFSELAAAFDAASAGISHPISRILRLAETIAGFALERPALYRLMFDVTQPEFEAVPGEMITEQRRIAWAHPVKAFEDAVGQGFVQGDPAVLPHLFFAAIHGLIEFELSRQSDPRRTLEHLMKPMLRLLLRGAAADPSVVRRVDRLRVPPKG